MQVTDNQVILSHFRNDEYRTVSIKNKIRLTTLLDFQKLEESPSYIFKNTSEYQNINKFIRGEITVKDLVEKFLVVNTFNKVIYGNNSTGLLNMLEAASSDEPYDDYEFSTPMYATYNTESNKLQYCRGETLRKDKARVIKNFEMMIQENPILSGKACVVEITKYSKLFEHKTIEEVTGTWPSQIVDQTGIVCDLASVFRDNPLKIITDVDSPTAKGAMKSVNLIKVTGNNFSRVNLYDYYMEVINERNKQLSGGRGSCYPCESFWC